MYSLTSCLEYLRKTSHIISRQILSHIHQQTFIGPQWSFDCYQCIPEWIKLLFSITEVYTYFYKTIWWLPRRIQESLPVVKLIINPPPIWNTVSSLVLKDYNTVLHFTDVSEFSYYYLICFLTNARIQGSRKAFFFLQAW